MNRKIIYVDFIFKRKKISSKPLLLIYKLKINVKRLFNNLFRIYSAKNTNTENNIKHYPFKKVL
ncbi:MAG: hypothetical protein HUJ77_07780 [Clostridium sp.]|uniref:hypothetical protein n=1 Tax=Clostridium sp. TaxID=1506 RepID=UPI0025C217D4|nr:hypothetical protein [Clostridium sp.]MCF0148283.1 hypothetical protein [Clostridium sp.]